MRSRLLCWAALILMTAPLLHGQSFDCAKATTRAEKLVCGKDGADLRLLDVKLAQTYKQAVARLTTQEEKFQL